MGVVRHVFAALAVLAATAAAVAVVDGGSCKQSGMAALSNALRAHAQMDASSVASAVDPALWWTGPAQGGHHMAVAPVNGLGPNGFGAVLMQDQRVAGDTSEPEHGDDEDDAEGHAATAAIALVCSDLDVGASCAWAPWTHDEGPLDTLLKGLAAGLHNKRGGGRISPLTMFVEYGGDNDDDADLPSEDDDDERDAAPVLAAADAGRAIHVELRQKYTGVGGVTIRCREGADAVNVSLAIECAQRDGRKSNCGALAGSYTLVVSKTAAAAPATAWRHSRSNGLVQLLVWLAPLRMFGYAAAGFGLLTGAAKLVAMRKAR